MKIPDGGKILRDAMGMIIVDVNGEATDYETDDSDAIDGHIVMAVTSESQYIFVIFGACKTYYDSVKCLYSWNIRQIHGDEARPAHVCGRYSCGHLILFYEDVPLGRQDNPLGRQDNPLGRQDNPLGRQNI